MVKHMLAYLLFKVFLRRLNKTRVKPEEEKWAGYDNNIVGKNERL